MCLFCGANNFSFGGDFCETVVAELDESETFVETGGVFERMRKCLLASFVYVGEAVVVESDEGEAITETKSVLERVWECSVAGEGDVCPSVIVELDTGETFSEVPCADECL